MRPVHGETGDIPKEEITMKINFEMENCEMESIMNAISSAVKAYTSYETEQMRLRHEEDKAKRDDEATKRELQNARDYLKEVTNKIAK